MLQCTVPRVEIFMKTQVPKFLSRQFVFCSKLKLTGRKEFKFPVLAGVKLANNPFYAATLFQSASAESSASVPSANFRGTQVSSRRVLPCSVSFSRSVKTATHNYLTPRKKNLEGSALSRRCFSSCSEHNGMELEGVVSVLKKIASPSLAGSWDNVGLLLEPSPPHTVSTLLLTNDLTPQVMQEAVDKGVDMIVSYHPPIFAPLKRVTQNSWKERIVAKCLERRIALYSPHTSWDAAAQGVNDWLISAFDVKDVGPIEQTVQASGRNKKLTFWTTAESATRIASLPAVENDRNIHLYREPVASESGGGGEGSVKVCLQCSSSAVPSILAALEEQHIAVDNVECCDLAKLPRVGHGMGRMGRLQSPVTVQSAVSAIKTHLNLQHVRLAQAAEGREVNTVAVCAGSGGSVLRGVKADLYLTGEMSHHEVLDAVCGGTHVVLCDHSNTERGFLKVMQARLTEQMAQRKVQVMVSETDRDPLVVV